MGFLFFNSYDIIRITISGEELFMKDILKKSFIYKDFYEELLKYCSVEEEKAIWNTDDENLCAIIYAGLLIKRVKE